MSTDATYTTLAMNAWKTTIERLDKMFASISDDELLREIAPGRNRVIYLLGHLTAVHDRMLPLLRLGDRLHPELDDPFLTKPDRVSEDVAPAALRKAWSDVNARLGAAMAALSPAEWLERHESISAADFTKEPLRNRLSVLLARTSHAAFHQGQITLGVKKA